MKNIVIITGASSGFGALFATKLDERLNSIDEYWLNINIPFNEGVIYKPDDTLNVESDYTRIYLSTYELGDTPLRIK